MGTTCRENTDFAFISDDDDKLRYGRGGYPPIMAQQKIFMTAIFFLIIVVIRMTIQLQESPIPTHKNMAISPLVGKRPDFWSRFRFSRKKSENAENKLMS